MRAISLVPLPLLLSLALPAAAQTPPIKTGLWQVHMDRTVDGQKAPDAAERLKNLPPAQRAQVEAMMKQRGLDISGNGSDLKICLDKASLDAGQWRREQGTCKTDYSTQSAARWTWKSVCTTPMASTSTGETVFDNPESYTTRINSVMTVEGRERATQMTMKSTFVSGSCGDVKPVQPGFKQ